MKAREARGALWPVIRHVYRSVMEHGVTDLAAALAYYFLLSLFPMMIFLVTLLPYLQIDPDSAVRFVNGIVPVISQGSIDGTIREIVSQRQEGLLSFSLLATLWVASNGVSAIIRMLNIAYEVEENRHIVRVRLLSLSLTVGLVVGLSILLVFSVFGDVLLHHLAYFIPLEKISGLFTIMKWFASLFLTVIVLVGIYQIAPATRLPLKEVIVGALVTATGWQISSLGFSFYVSNFSNYSATYGSLGGVIVLMIWFYLTGMFLIMGGVINAAIHRHRWILRRS
ncbi:YihY/virulence factor BrkB family protein [Marininema halotolerans]|uniref:Membrane protein n=1 Tax=Marininema halotolerans TaxID=1155944 RepID=A0A1I6TJ78_9BACL|nr:YihY/virulence factor BrkB family protein [Marininema halotolerans]SFS89269.1 membrane protein [Marininema halotolerans]